MLLEDVAAGLGDERAYPDGGLEALLADRLQHALHVAAEGLAGFQPVAHGRLIAVVQLDVFELRRVLDDGGEIVHHVLAGDARAETIPAAPAGGRSLEAQRRMVLVDPVGEPGEQCGAIGAAGEGELFEIPGFAGSEREALGVEHDFDGFRTQEEAAVEAVAAGEGEQHGLATGRSERHHAGDYFGIGRLRDLVMLQLVIGKIDRLAERTRGLREHLKALAVQRGVVREIVRDPEERDFLDVHERLARIGEARTVQVALPIAHELDGRARLDGANLGLTVPYIKRRRGGENERTGKKEGKRAKHALYFSAIYRCWGNSLFNAETQRTQRKTQRKPRPLWPYVFSASSSAFSASLR